MIEAKGPISVNLLGLVELLATSTVFGARLEAPGGQAAVRDRIHWPHVEKDLWDYERPLAVVMDGNLTYDKYAGGESNHLKPSGRLELVLSDDDRYPNSPKDSQIDFSNFVGELLKDLACRSGIDENLSIIRIETMELPKITHPKERASVGSFWLAKYGVDWAWV